MKQYLISTLYAVFLTVPATLHAQDAFTRGLLEDRTLRVDLIFTGTDRTCEIALDELLVSEGWAGRRCNMDKVPVRGNGEIILSTLSDEPEVLYRHSFSTLFQEWQATEEAVRVRRSFENVFLLPMPCHKAQIQVKLYDFHGNVASDYTFDIDPADILVRPCTGRKAYSGGVWNDVAGTKYIHRAGSPDKCIDLTIVAEGYTATEMQQFYDDAEKTFRALMNHKPFGEYRDRINVLAVGLESEDSGVSIPDKGIWKSTALSSHFDTFYSDRYLTTLRLKKMHDALAGLPYEHIIILANTDNYGGGGIYNSYTLTTAHHSQFKPVVVHEFGHSFGGLADEYYYDDQYVEYYYPGVEPWEQNITTLADFTSKWSDMMDPDTPVPTPEGFYPDGRLKACVFEGAGYQSKGVYRAFRDCRMKTNGADSFCPVCQRALSRMILFQTEEIR